MEELDRFLNKYSTDLLFNNINYRKGARITSPFCLTEGYRKIDSSYVWDSIRVHSGVDRSGKYDSRGNQLKENVAIAPFDFDIVKIYDYGKEHIYGSLVRLFNNEFGFEMRIIHMNPEDVLIKNNESIVKNTIIGKAGNYGSASDGAHTHTEFVSLKNTCEVFDNILYKNYGILSEKDYTDIEIFNIYKTAKYFKDSTPEEILEHYSEIKNIRKIVGVCNRFKYVYRDWFNRTICTRYSSELLFNKL